MPPRPRPPRAPGHDIGAGLEAAMRNIRTLDGARVTVGVQARDGSTVEPGPEGLTLATIAARQHFGYSGESEGPIGPSRAIHKFYGNPARPWLTRALYVNRDRWTKLARKPAKLVARDPQAAAASLRVLGVVMAADAKRSITEGDWTPNSARTIALKKSSRPLIDTGRLLNSQRAVVELPGQPPVVLG